jgi:hypothetical protein
MAVDELPGESPGDDPTFESEMRQQRDLMRQMASREKWDGESRWIIQGRRLAGGALYFAAIVAVVLILWIVTSIILGS